MSEKDTSIIKITIPNWEKYNPRKDVNNGTWIRLNVDVFTGPSLYELDCSEKAVWVFILTLCAKKLGSVELKLGWCASLGFPEKIVRSAVQKLEILGCVQSEHIGVRQADADVRARTHTSATNERTNVTNERTNERTKLPFERTNGRAFALQAGQI